MRTDWGASLFQPKPNIAEPSPAWVHLPAFVDFARYGAEAVPLAHVRAPWSTCSTSSKRRRATRLWASTWSPPGMTLISGMRSRSTGVGWGKRKTKSRPCSPEGSGTPRIPLHLVRGACCATLNIGVTVFRASSRRATASGASRTPFPFGVKGRCQVSSGRTETRVRTALRVLLATFHIARRLRSQVLPGPSAFVPGARREQHPVDEAGYGARARGRNPGRSQCLPTSPTPSRSVSKPISVCI